MLRGQRGRSRRNQIVDAQVERAGNLGKGVRQHTLLAGFNVGDCRTGETGLQEGAELLLSPTPTRVIPLDCDPSSQLKIEVLDRLLFHGQVLPDAAFHCQAMLSTVLIYIFYCARSTIALPLRKCEPQIRGVWQVVASGRKLQKRQSHE